MTLMSNMCAIATVIDKIFIFQEHIHTKNVILKI